MHLTCRIKIILLGLISFMLQLTTANSANACAICTQQCRGESGFGRALCELSCNAQYTFKGCPPTRKKSIGWAPSSAAGTITITPTNTNIGADIKVDIQYPEIDTDSPIAPQEHWLYQENWANPLPTRQSGMNTMSSRKANSNPCQAERWSKSVERRKNLLNRIFKFAIN